MAMRWWDWLHSLGYLSLFVDTFVPRVSVSSFSYLLTAQNMRLLNNKPLSSPLRVTTKWIRQLHTPFQLRSISYSAFRDGDISSDHPDNHKIFSAARQVRLATKLELLRNDATTDNIKSEEYSPLPSVPTGLLPIDPNAIEFHADEHTYSYQGRKIPCSVTQVIASYFPGFNKHEQILKMMTGDNWPRPEYTHPITNMPFTKEEILLQWAKISKEALFLGTKLHVHIENLLNDWNVVQGWVKNDSNNNDNNNDRANNNTTTTTTTKNSNNNANSEANSDANNAEELVVEKQQVASFLKSFLQKKNIAVLATEMRLVAPDLGIAGSVDFIGRYIDPNATEITSKDVTFAPGQDRVVLIDWKRSKDLAQSAFKHYNKYGKQPWGHIPACDGYKYALQVNLYRYILQRYYSVRIDDMYIVSFHPDQALPMDHNNNACTQDNIGYYQQEQPLMHKKPTPTAENISNMDQSQRVSNALITPVDTSTSINNINNNRNNSGNNDDESTTLKTGYYILKVANLQEEIELMLRHYVHVHGKQSSSSTL